MRIHRLTLQAVGPFPDRHTIDFDSLSAGGLFLLEGPTGAGKSTIIDAVVFALYGTVAGGESSDDRLHSDHAAPEVEPYVELTFSTGAGIYRVWRSPRFERPKRRGGGTTTQNARAKLWRLSTVEDEGEPVSAQVQEVGTELGRIVVLDRSQFTQTVVLPQGQFASFLRARPEDRRAVLQDVFGTEIYDRLQKRLAEMARGARADLDRATSEVSAAASAFATCLDPATETSAPAADDDATPTATAPADGTGTGTGIGTEDGVTADAIADTADREALLDAATHLDDAALSTITEDVCARAEARATRAEEARESAAAAETTARSLLDAARDLASRLERRRTLLDEEQAHRKAQPAVQAATEKLERARRAASVMPVLDQHERAVDRLARATAERESQLEQARTAGLTDLAELGDPDALRTVHDDATGQLGALAELVEVEAALPRRRTELETARAEAAAATGVIGELEGTLAARPAGQEALEEALDQYRDAGVRRERALTEKRRAGERLAAARHAAAAADELVEAEHAVATTADRAGAALDTEHEVRRRWVAGMAGKLAGGLRAGEPCAVCGSAEHPAPARATPEHASDEEVAEATEVRERADAALAHARTRLVSLTEKVAALREAAGGLDVDEALSRDSAAQAELAAAEAAIVRHAQLEQELSDHARETNRLRERLAEASSRAASLHERVDQLARHLAADEERCLQGRGSATSVAGRAAELRGRARTARALLEAVSEELAARGAREEAGQHLADALAQGGFEDAEAVRAAMLPESSQRALAERLQRHSSEVARVAAGLAEAGVAALTGTEIADVSGAESAHAAAMVALTRAAGAASEARLRCRQAREAADSLLAALAAHGERARRAAPVLRAAALATAGDGNTIDTTLATYVLLRRFEDVVAAANDRLALMSDGRYTLERIDEREGGQRSRKAGLGLRVRDHVTEAPRDPHTLSGGETFYVSLCLALGLADVVRAEAGGVELGTLFVDEGFGSLDPATLDAVMGELGRLREGGRSVGIVSHVADLKDRIAERIEVRRLPSGASTLTVRC
ncbi:exonuclease SbcC [Georgenia soli]|uniref:Nuclease SbcCD subunit C n=1 Tax=Georgenia soli TaxID=638953 RepID=A0A2A9EQX7_9MICO|nr:SMC family ATPase [Georgenia soli]PFG40650.1 exonuclease SbcC [Georgenia soli]